MVRSICIWTSEIQLERPPQNWKSERSPSLEFEPWTGALRTNGLSISGGSSAATLLGLSLTFNMATQCVNNSRSKLQL